MNVAIPEHVIAAVRGYFEQGAFRRGLEYARQGRVQLVKQGWPAVAQVRGSSGYVTTVYYTNPTLPNRDMYGECSCPVGMDCKHVVATALVALIADDADHESWEVKYKQERVGDWLSQMSLTIDTHDGGAPTRNAVVYIIAGGRIPTITVHRCIRRKRGGYGKGSAISGVADPARGIPSWVPVDDLRLISTLRAIGRTGNFGTAIEMARLGGQELRDLAATERLFWEATSNPPLVYGDGRQGQLAWAAFGEAEDEYRVEVDAEFEVLPTSPLHYLDRSHMTIGPLDVGVPAPVVQELLRAPPVPVSMLPTVRKSLAPLLAGRGGDRLVGDRDQHVDLTPYLFVGLHPDRDRGPLVAPESFARYGDEQFALGEWDPNRPSARDMVEEGRRLERLRELLEQYSADYSAGPAMAQLAEARYVAHTVVPTLIEEGWSCELCDDFPVEPLATPAGWVEELEPRPDANNWFSLELGVVVDGRTVSLLPILLDAIRSGDLPLDTQLFDERALPGMTLELPDGHRVYVSGPRLQRWLRPLIELQMRGLDQQEVLRVPEFVAVSLADAEPGRFAAQPVLEAARDRLAALIDLAPRDEPEDFGTELRPYQREGLAWLHFLHDAGYGGLLADDMGLGKTVQVLAFLRGLLGAGLSEATPALVVAPRSVVGHWVSEAKRFAPALAPVAHVGSSRATGLDGLRVGNLIVTSYQTMLRDAALLAQVSWCSALFDEAQAVKNPRAKVRKAAATLEATSRFCITGTPMENHLSELWSQLDLVMPGLLGNQVTFNALFRRPIEKHGSTVVLEVLRQRIRPFMLRRTKDAVALDLPPKTEVVERVNMGSEQRDFYESLRLSLEPQVRKALANKKIAGSSLTVLDALLKLRQVCCHPRLVNTPEAKKQRASAKLDRLMNMLDELADEGRFVLVFSQFTSMLDIIAQECERAGIGHLMLTGSTRDRDAVIDAFQAGEAPVFLISLKAGGTGLNLTRADTVIHYDPWWNPAAEDQATDRAHRIGQDKNIFVYKLVASGTLEERIIDMQDDKRALADAALRDGGASHLAVTDLEALYRRLV